MVSDRDRFDKFTERSRKVLSLAQEEAQRFQHNYIGTEHLLLGMVREGEGVAGKVLASFGVDLNRARSAVEFIIGRGDRIVLGEIGLTPRSKQVIELAVDEARRLNHHYIGTEHLLLGLIREGEGIGAGVLESLGVNLEEVHARVIQIFSTIESSASTTSPSTTAPSTDRERFDKFTERARRALDGAQEEARRFQHNYIGTEHLLLGLTDAGGGVAIEVLHNLGVEPSKVRAAVEFIIARSEHIVVGELGLTSNAKQVIELAVDEARRLNHHYIGTEHLLLGLVREGEGIAAGVLESLGINMEKVRAETVRVLNRGGSSASTTSSSTTSFSTKSDPRDTFTEQALKALSLSQEEAQRFQHNYIGTEHLLLGILGEREFVAARVLANMGVELAKIRAAVEFIIGRGDRIVLGEVGLTPRAKKVIELAVDEARRLNHRLIGTEHFLLGLVREGEGIAAGVLDSLGVNLERTRAETIRVLSEDIGSAPAGNAGTEGDPSLSPAAQEQENNPFSMTRPKSLSPDQFDRFTEQGKRVLFLAQEEARRFQHNYIGTEHLLLGLVRENVGVATLVLNDLRVELNRVRSAVEFIIGYGEHAISGEIDLTPASKKVIELTFDEARRLNHHYIGAEHLLLGLVREGEGIAVGVLESLGVNLQDVRERTLRLISPLNAPSSPADVPVSPGTEETTSPGQTPLSQGTQLLTFLRGDPQIPKGHAIFVVRSHANSDIVLSTYCIVPPMPLSLAKYLPSFLASQLSPEELQDSTNVPVMPIPPMLEGEQSLEQIRALAADRDDDICEIGASRPKDESENMQLVAQGCQEYGQLYVNHASTFRPQPSSVKATNSPGMGEAVSSDENRVPLFTFLRGDSQAPKGHAIFIAHSSADSHTVLATYCVIPPTPLSLTKYLPSFLASQLSQEELQDATNVPVMPVPPMLEEGSTLEQLEMLAERRDDDLVDLGSINPRDEAARMQLVAQNCQEYGQLYVKRTSTLQPEPPVTVETTSSNEIVLSHRIHLFTLPFCHVIADKHLRTTLTNWLQGAAAAGWSIPLALAHDLGLLLCLPASQRTIARPTYLPFNEDTSAYLACLERLDAHPLMRELSSWSPPLSDSVISVLLARLIEGLDFPQEYRIPGGAEGKRFLRALEYEMAHTDPAILWEQMPQEARPSWNSLLPANALDRLERNLQALNREEVRFLAHYGPGVSGSLDPRTLLDLLALTGLPDTTRLALSQTLSLLPHVSDSTVLHFGGIQTYPEGGYEGVARQGSLESLLPSENAYTDEIFLHRVLNQEALYYGRERPRAQRREIAYLVGQLGWGLGGDGQVLMRALLLALNQAMQQRGYDVFYSLAGATLTPPATLEKPEEVGRLLYVQEHGSVNSELILRSVLANLRSWRSHYLRRHVFWVLGENFDADTVQEHTSLYRELQAEGEQQVWYIRVGQVPAQSDDVESPPVTARRFGRWQIMESGRIWGDEKAVIS